MQITKIINEFKDVFYYKTLESHLRGCSSVLDVGCGSDSPLAKIKKFFSSHGVDTHKPSILKSKDKKIHDQYTVGNINRLRSNFKIKSFDAVIALDVIEHFPKEDSYKLIQEMEKIARKKVILLTPNGFYPQDGYDSNPYQIHKSGWSSKDLQRLGYKVYGLRGIKYLRGDYATIKYKPWILWGALAFISEPFLYSSPELSYDLFAVKNIK
ncbi:MAG: class I SAM-dependent methyltransferase [Candidatus Levybacteria bacterium]|nr:class I SAM-dependent methyltransferase [Candidatus Levybacteria bacterium]